MLDKQHLRAPTAGEDVLQVLDDLLGCHATVAVSPYLQLRARVRTFTAQQLDGLLDHGRAAKLACMRQTLFIESAELLPLVFAATRELAERGRERFLAANGLTPSRYEHMAEGVAAQLAGRALNARQLRKALAATTRISPVIIVMCDQGRLIRWKGSRGWNSAQPTYRRVDEALPTIQLDTWEQAAAVRELVGRYIRRYGPVTDGDIAWWTGLRKNTVHDAIASLPNLTPASVEGLTGTFHIHEADVADAQRGTDPTVEDVSLLPVLDPYLQSYRNRERSVDPQHRPFVVDRGGNTTSVILIAGRAAGVWDHITKPSPALRLFFFERPNVASRARVLTVATEVAEFLADEPPRVIEVEHMTPLTKGTAGAFLSPLKGSR